MALTTCAGCGARVSDQWPECPGCGRRRGASGSGGARRKRFSATPHYLIATALATVGTLLLGGQLLGGGDLRQARVAMVLCFLGASWYAAARMIAFFRD